MDHSDLVSEMHTVENLPTQERLHLARMRRAQQLKVARQKEKEWQKLQSRRDKNQLHSQKNRRHISFENSVVLLEAAGRNDIQEVAHLLQRGITPDAANEDGLTALHQCCIDNNIEMLKLLLDYGANVDAQDSDKWTPLHAAATCGHLNLVKILISRGANLLSVNTDGNMPYDLCDDEETLDYIEAEMSKRGVTQELIDETRALTEKQMLNDLMVIASQGGDLEEPDHQGATPLHIASANGYTRVVEFLLEHHISVDAVDKDLWSPIHAAACWGHLEVLEMLAQYGADLNARNKDDETPSDICEDPEIRERIEQLKSEQESKRLAEAQRRRVRRSQSNNTRAQSVRRTSLRDKTLTTKKDAVEETRLRLQAQEVFITPDSTTDPKSISSDPTSHSSSLVPNNNSALSTSDYNNSRKGSHPKQSHPGTTSSSTTTATTTIAGDLEVSSTAGTPPSSGVINNNVNGNISSSSSSGGSGGNHSNSNSGSAGNHNNSNNNNTTGGNHNNNSTNNNNNNSPHLNGSSKGPNSFYNGYNSYVSPHPQVVVDPTTLNSRRPPEGKDNDEFALRDKMLITGSNSMGSLHKITSDRSTEIFSTTKENGKINVQVTVLVDTHNLDNALSGTTLANLKKQRSQSRSNALTENGSVISGTTSHSITSGTTNSTIGGQPLELSVIPSTSDSNSSLIIGGQMATSNTTTTTTQLQPVTKFSGITGDVVSDSTRSKKCCLLM